MAIPSGGRISRLLTFPAVYFPEIPCGRLNRGAFWPRFGDAKGGGAREGKVDRAVLSPEQIWRQIDNILEIPRHAGQWAEFLKTTLYYGLLDPYNPLSAGPDAALAGWSWRVLGILGIDVGACGLENVHHHRSQIFFVNHQSNIDVLILGATVPVPFFWLYKHTLDRMPIIGRALRRQGHVSIVRTDPVRSRESIEKAARLVREGKNLLVFPEGTRSGSPQMRPFKKGVFHLAIDAGAPIVPVSIAHSWKIMPRGSLRLQPTRVNVRFHPAIDVSAYGRESLPQLMDAVRAAIQSGLDQDGDVSDAT